MQCYYKLSNYNLSTYDIRDNMCCREFLYFGAKF